MPRNSKFNKNLQESKFAQTILKGIDDQTKLLNAIDFIEGPQGLRITLYPVQRVVVKAMFGVPFDYYPDWIDRIPDWGKVTMWDAYREKKLRVVDEAEYLHICHDEGRCNVDDWRDIPWHGFREAAIFAGRRGGKSELVAAIAAYKLYLLLNIRSPQEYFGLMPGSILDFTFLAQDDRGADRLFKKLREDVNHSHFFDPYLKDNNQKSLSFVSEADRLKSEVTPTIMVWSLPCTTNAVRGPSSIFLALDEFAHFRSEVGSTSDDMYAAATPATGTFHHKDYEHKLETGEPMELQDSTILSISSPLKRVGKMFELHKLAMKEGPKGPTNLFTLCCSSAEMNPTLLPSFLKSEETRSPLTWKAEFGGRFLESSESYVPEASIKACVDVKWDEWGDAIVHTGRLNYYRFDPKWIGRQYFWGFDLAMSKDASALAIAHLEYGGVGGIKLIFDYIDRMMVGEKFEGIGITNMFGEQKYVTQADQQPYKHLVLTDVLLWLQEMNKIFPCFKGATDQHGGQMLIQLLGAKDIHNVELLNLTPAINSKMAYNLKGRIEQQLVSFPYVPKFISELKLVEAEVVSRYMLRVQAPEEKGSHDDMVDSVMLVSYLANEWLTKNGFMQLDPTGMSLTLNEQAQKPPAPVPCLDGIPMAQLKIRDRMLEIQKRMALRQYASGTAPVSPWHKRGRR
jgi:hypothetical protein